MALVNLGATAMNADGSATLFGPQGNAVAQLSNGSAFNIFAAPSLSSTRKSIPITFAPAPTQGYFQTLLTNPQLFQTLSAVTIFKMYMALEYPDETLQAFFADCAANNVKLGIEAPALIADTGSSNVGVEGFASTGAMIAGIQRIQSLGGVLSYLWWDEPFFYGCTVTGAYTMAGAASAVAAAGAAVKAIFPDVKIGDIEPVDPAMNSPATLSEWLAAYEQAAGEPFSSFLADPNTETLGWQANLATSLATVRATGMSVGTIDTANGAPPSNTAWATMAVAVGLDMLSGPATRPDFIDVQSWQIYPDETPSPTVPGTLASVAADIQAGANAALSVPAMASYTVYGDLQSVTWSGGCTAAQNGTNLIFTSSTGEVAKQFAWRTVKVFVFNPNNGTVSLTVGTTAYIVNGSTGSLVFSPASSAGTTPPNTLTVALAASSTAGAPGSGYTNQPTPTLAGAAAPNSTISLQLDGSSLGTAVASASGSWTFKMTTQLAVGAHLIGATGGATAGGASQSSLCVISYNPTQH